MRLAGEVVPGASVAVGSRSRLVTTRLTGVAVEVAVEVDVSIPVGSKKDTSPALG